MEAYDSLLVSELAGTSMLHCLEAKQDEPWFGTQGKQIDSSLHIQSSLPHTHTNTHTHTKRRRDGRPWGQAATTYMTFRTATCFVLWL